MEKNHVGLRKGIQSGSISFYAWLKPHLANHRCYYAQLPCCGRTRGTIRDSSDRKLSAFVLVRFTSSYRRCFCVWHLPSLLILPLLRSRRLCGLTAIFEPRFCAKFAKERSGRSSSSCFFFFLHSCRAKVLFPQTSAEYSSALLCLHSHTELRYSCLSNSGKISKDLLGKRNQARKTQTFFRDRFKTAPLFPSERKPFSEICVFPNVAGP